MKRSFEEKQARQREYNKWYSKKYLEVKGGYRPDKLKTPLKPIEDTLKEWKVDN